MRSFMKSHRHGTSTDTFSDHDGDGNLAFHAARKTSGHRTPVVLGASSILMVPTPPPTQKVPQTPKLGPPLHTKPVPRSLSASKSGSPKLVQPPLFLHSTPPPSHAQSPKRFLSPIRNLFSSGTRPPASPVILLLPSFADYAYPPYSQTPILSPPTRSPYTARHPSPSTLTLNEPSLLSQFPDPAGSLSSTSLPGAPDLSAVSIALMKGVTDTSLEQVSGISPAYSNPSMISREFINDISSSLRPSSPSRLHGSVSPQRQGLRLSPDSLGISDTRRPPSQRFYKLLAKRKVNFSDPYDLANSISASREYADSDESDELEYSSRFSFIEGRRGGKNTLIKYYKTPKAAQASNPAVEQATQYSDEADISDYDYDNNGYDDEDFMDEEDDVPYNNIFDGSPQESNRAGREMNDITSPVQDHSPAQLLASPILHVNKPPLAVVEAPTVISDSKPVAQGYAAAETFSAATAPERFVSEALSTAHGVRPVINSRVHSGNSIPRGLLDCTLHGLDQSTPLRSNGQFMATAHINNNDYSPPYSQSSPHHNLPLQIFPSDCTSPESNPIPCAQTTPRSNQDVRSISTPKSNKSPRSNTTPRGVASPHVNTTPKSDHSSHSTATPSSLHSPHYDTTPRSIPSLQHLNITPRSNQSRQHFNTTPRSNPSSQHLTVTPQSSSSPRSTASPRNVTPRRQHPQLYDHTSPCETSLDRQPQFSSLNTPPRKQNAQRAVDLNGIPNVQASPNAQRVAYPSAYPNYQVSPRAQRAAHPNYKVLPTVQRPANAFPTYQASPNAQRVGGLNSAVANKKGSPPAAVHFRHVSGEAATLHRFDASRRTELGPQTPELQQQECTRAVLDRKPLPALPLEKPLPGHVNRTDAVSAPPFAHARKWSEPEITGRYHGRDDILDSYLDVSRLPSPSKGGPFGLFTNQTRMNKSAAPASPSQFSSTSANGFLVSAEKGPPRAHRHDQAGHLPEAWPLSNGHNAGTTDVQGRRTSVESMMDSLAFLQSSADSKTPNTYDSNRQLGHHAHGLTQLLSNGNDARLTNLAHLSSLHSLLYDQDSQTFAGDCLSHYSKLSDLDVDSDVIDEVNQLKDDGDLDKLAALRSGSIRTTDLSPNYHRVMMATSDTMTKPNQIRTFNKTFTIFRDNRPAFNQLGSSDASPVRTPSLLSVKSLTSVCEDAFEPVGANGRSGHVYHKTNLQSGRHY